MGTGIYIGDNKILTCNHLVETTKEDIIKAKFYQSNDWNKCTIIRASKKDDLLLLKLDIKEMGVVQTNISIENGDSGGPIFNANGEIVGINSFRLLDSYGNPTYASSYAVSIKEIREFLSNE